MLVIEPHEPPLAKSSNAFLIVFFTIIAQGRILKMVIETPHKYVVKRHTSHPSTLFVIGIGHYLGSLCVTHAFGRITTTAIAYYIHNRLGDFSIQELTDYKSTLQALLTTMNMGSRPSSVLVVIGDTNNRKTTTHNSLPPTHPETVPNQLLCTHAFTPL